MTLFERLGAPQSLTSWDSPSLDEPLPEGGLPPLLDWLLMIHFVLLMAGFSAAMVLGG